MPNPYRLKMIQGFKKGDRMVIERTFTEKDTQAFGDLTHDYNPVHYDTRWTDARNFKGLICHGLLVGSMVCELGGQVGWLASGMTFRFIRPVYFDDTVRCIMTLEELAPDGRAKASAVFENQHQEQVGYAELYGKLPVGGDLKILEQMVEEGDPTNPLSDKTYPLPE